jgi:hypothetical protein
VTLSQLKRAQHYAKRDVVRLNNPACSHFGSQCPSAVPAELRRGIAPEGRSVHLVKLIEYAIRPSMDEHASRDFEPLGSPKQEKPPTTQEFS